MLESPIDVDTLLNAVNELVDHPTQQNLELVGRLLGEAPNVKEFLSGPAVVSIKSGQIKRAQDGKVIQQAKDRGGPGSLDSQTRFISGR